MDKLVFDNGVREYEVNGHILRFNPSDPNVYSRFLRAVEEIKSLDAENTTKVKDKTSYGSYMLHQMETMDSRVKDFLSKAFGCGNDFHAIFDGVNIAAKNTHGERVLDAFIQAVQPVMLKGMEELLAKDNTDIERYAGEYE